LLSGLIQRVPGVTLSSSQNEKGHAEKHDSWCGREARARERQQRRRGSAAPHLGDL